MQPGEVGSNGAIAGGDHLKRPVERLGDLPQGGIQCRRVCAESYSAVAMIAMASAKDVSIRIAVSVIGIITPVSPMGGDCPKYMLVQFGSMST